MLITDRTTVRITTLSTLTIALFAATSLQSAIAQSDGVTGRPPSFTYRDVQSKAAPASAVNAVASTALEEKGGRKGRIGRGRATFFQHSGKTASGERYNPDGMTAAHHSLPLGSHVRVVNESNGRSAIVRINDRTNQATNAKRPYAIDLSRGSARAIGITSVGQVALYRVD